jgi:crotonobetainyl-CoA:carnitine CoA-transferase CaiB-like acyl-CoA transferase
MSTEVRSATESASERYTAGPLSGLRVLELGGWAAGPVVGKHLANQGAEVIRIESRRRLDGFRTNYPPFKDNVPGPDRAAIFNYFNDGKRSISLNLKHPRALELARRLVAGSDVVVENFTPGTMARLGLGYAELSADNPGLVMLSTCNQGQRGPHAHHAGFGTHLTALSGFTQLLGYPDRTPALLYGPYIDFIAVGYGTIAVLAALRRRKRTGRGCWIDLSQYETGLQVMAPALLDLFANGRVATRAGNRDAVAVPHGVFPCRGQEQWVALSVADDDEWARFVAALEAPDWTSDPAFATVHDRRANEDRLEALIAAWTAERHRNDVVERLLRQQVPVYPVNSMADLYADPQLAHRGTWRPVEHPVLGKVHVAAPPFRLSATPPPEARPAPLLGADNRFVLGEILGLSAEQIAELDQAGALE